MDKLDKKAFLQKARDNGMLHEDYEVIDSTMTIFPFFDRDSGDVMRSASIIYKLSNILKSNHFHNVIVSLVGKNFYIWCGDAFISGGKTRTPADAEVAVTKIAKSKSEHQAMMKLYASSKDKPCHFWANSHSCSHSNMVLALIDEKPSILKNLEELLEPKSSIAANRTPEEILQKFKFKKHVMLRGDKGSGKTHLALSFAKKVGADVFYYGGHEKTESSDFIGEYIPTTVKEEKIGVNLFDGGVISHLSMVWKDGPLAKAIRNASEGKKSIFLLDEVLRVPSEELSSLISALAPSPDGKFQLGTRRAIDVIDELAIEEVLSCPMENLWVITTTNIGSSYSVGRVDEAFADRMRMVQMDTDLDIMEKILKTTAKRLKYKAGVVAKLLSFYKVFEKRRTDGGFNKIVNQRHLIEALECAVDENDIKETLWETRLAWIDDDYDGKPNAEQVKEIEKMLNKIF